MDRRFQLAANVALIAVALLYGIQTIWPGALPRVGQLFVSMNTGSPEPTVPPPPTTAQPPPIPVPVEPVSIAGAPRLGSPDAPVALIEYSDFECPFCEQFHRTTLPVIRSEYIDRGRAAFVYRHLPLPTLHPHAVRAAEAAVCAARQGKFWRLHDAMFENRRALDDAGLEWHAGRSGLDLARLRTCLAEGEASEQVRSDAAEAARFGLTGTPAFLEGVRDAEGRVQVLQVIKGSRPIEDFRAALDEALAASAAGDATR